MKSAPLIQSPSSAQSQPQLNRWTAAIQWKTMIYHIDQLARLGWVEARNFAY